LGIRQPIAVCLIKQLFNPEDIERKVILILKILNENSDSQGVRVIARKMKERGVQLSERTVRYHLKLMDERELTKLVGRHDGRIITSLGLDEINNARVRDKISLSISRIDVLSFQTIFDIKKRCGLIPVNISFFRKSNSARLLQ
jgi:repressor of nif and glnA expression